MPAWRAERTLARTLRSLFANREVVERVLVVTEASDASAAVARSFVGVEVVALGARASAGRARNIGRERARALGEPDLLLFIDADCALERGAVSRLIDAVDGRALDAAGAAVTGEGGGAIGWLRHLLEFKDFEPGVPAPDPAFVPSAALLVRAPVFDRIGGFPDMWPGEDLVFCDLVIASGGRLAKVDAACARHLHPGGVGEFLAHQARLGATSARARRMTRSLRGRVVAEHRWLAPLLFAGRAARAAAWLVRHRPHELWRFVVLAPLYAAGLAAWTAGFASRPPTGASPTLARVPEAA